MEDQYRSCDCESCSKISLSLGEGWGEAILNLAEKAFKSLHKNGGYRPEDLKKVREYRQLIGATAKLFSDQIPQEVPQEMKDYLQKDAFIFSGMRTHSQLAEAHSLLRNEKGEVRPYYQFEQDILNLNEKYNRNYLEAEYLFAKSSAQSAANWANYSDDTGRYLLQYRTAGDERVRESHAALNRTTLPKDAGFWLSYYPPNGWRCRCTVVEVRAARYDVSDEDRAITEGERATTQIGKNGKNKLEMFRFNPGKERRIFPKQNAYYPKHCNGGKVDLSGLIGHSYFVLSAEDDKCKALKIVTDEAGKKLQNRRVRESILAKKNELLKKKIKLYGLDRIAKFNSGSIKEIANQPFKWPLEKQYFLDNIDKICSNAEYLIKTDFKATRDYPFTHIYKINLEFAEAAMLVKENKDGEFIIYSISDSEKLIKIKKSSEG